MDLRLNKLIQLVKLRMLNQIYNNTTKLSTIDASGNLYVTGNLYLKSSNVNQIGWRDNTSLVGTSTTGTYWDWKNYDSITLNQSGIYLFSGYVVTEAQADSTTCYCLLSTNSSPPTGNSATVTPTFDATTLFYAGNRYGVSDNAIRNGTTVCYVTQYLTTSITIYLHGTSTANSRWDIQVTKIA